MFSHYLFDTFPGYTGTAGDSLTYHNRMKFSTKDRDNDNNRYHCSVKYRGEGGWWFSTGCGYSNLNGIYLGSSAKDVKGVVWYHAYNDVRSFKRAVMKICTV